MTVRNSPDIFLNRTLNLHPADFDFSPADKPFPRGEICLRGPSVFRRYFKREGDTRRAIDVDGWFHTGDLGMFDFKGRLRLIDRREHIRKLHNGYLVFPIKTEAVYSASKWVNSCFVDTESTSSFLVGVVVPRARVVESWAKSHRVPGTHLGDWISSPALHDEILKDLLTLGSRSALSATEQVREIFLHDTPFSVENGLLSPGLNHLIRPNLRIFYRADFRTIAAKHQGQQQQSSEAQSSLSPGSV